MSASVENRIQVAQSAASHLSEVSYYGPHFRLWKVDCIWGNATYYSLVPVP